jgi:HAMP domain-containing protein
MSTKHFAKRLILINRDFQLRYVGAAVALGIATTAISAILILFPLYYFEILKIPRFLPTPILIIMGMAGALNIAVIGIFGVYVTHRIAGPMFSMVRAFRLVEMGKWNTTLRVRAGDDLLYLVRNFNEMTDGLVAITRSDIDRLEAVCAQCSDPNTKESLFQFVSNVRERIGANAGSNKV